MSEQMRVQYARTKLRLFHEPSTWKNNQQSNTTKGRTEHQGSFVEAIGTPLQSAPGAAPLCILQINFRNN